MNNEGDANLIIDGILYVQYKFNNYKSDDDTSINNISAKFDWARVVSRRAERKCVRWQKHLEIDDSEVVVYLNRLSDFLWMLAREFENDWTPSK